MCAFFIMDEEASLHEILGEQRDPSLESREESGSTKDDSALEGPLESACGADNGRISEPNISSNVVQGERSPNNEGSGENVGEIQESMEVMPSIISEHDGEVLGEERTQLEEVVLATRTVEDVPISQTTEEVSNVAQTMEGEQGEHLVTVQQVVTNEEQVATNEEDPPGEELSAEGEGRGEDGELAEIAEPSR